MVCHDKFGQYFWTPGMKRAPLPGVDLGIYFIYLFIFFFWGGGGGGGGESDSMPSPPIKLLKICVLNYFLS